MQGENNSMDVMAPATEVSKELVRDSLIALSNLLPESTPVSRELLRDSLLLISEQSTEAVSSRPFNGNSSPANFSGLKENGEIEYHRSELISLSYTQPAEACRLPLAP